MKIGFIGLGNIATAIIGGMILKGISPDDIIGSSRTEKTAAEVRERFGIDAARDNNRVACAVDVLFLAVKPQNMEDVIAGIRDAVRPETIVISTAVGKELAVLGSYFGREVKLVRCMPNTPVLVGEGCSGVCRNAAVTDEEMARCMELLGSFGLAVEVPERLIDAVAGVCASSPAYVFMFLEALADSAVAAGIPRRESYMLVAQTVLGSAKLMLETKKHPGELKDMICSPAGTTIEGIRVLEEKSFRGTVMNAVKATFDKANKLS